MVSTDAPSGAAGPPARRVRLVRTIVESGLRRLADATPRTVVAELVCVQWVLAGVTASVVGNDGSIWIAIPQVVVVLPLVLVLLYATALRLGGRVFAAWAAAAWIALPYAGLVYANPSFRHDYAHLFLPHVLGLADDSRFLALVAFLAALYFTLRAIETALSVDVAIAVATAALGAALVPRAALVAAAPVVGLALGGRRRNAILAAAALAVLVAGAGGAVAAGLLSSPFANIGVTGPGNVLSTLSENFWSGRVLEWLGIAGVAGALRGRLTAGAMIGVALLAAFLSLHGEHVPVARNLSLLHALLPVWPSVTLAVASVPLLVPRRRPVARPGVTAAAEGPSPS
ncbi:MAG TPA: hypothetical protein VF327_03970 [Gaiellaceae bacterium]